MLHRNRQASPETFLQAIAPSREERVVAVACLFTWSWLAARCAQAGMPFVLGPALAMKAIPGGNAKNDPSDAHQIAGLLRGGMLPQASVSPAARRATRDLLRRRLSLARKRAELLTHVPNTHRPDTLPASEQQIADKAKRDGVAERCAAPAVQKRIKGDRTLIGYDEPLRRDVDLASVKAAKPPNAQPLSRLQTVPGMGNILRLVLLYEMHAIQRFPSGQDFLAYCRRVQGAKAAAGKCAGTAGAKSGNASLPWAFSAAAVLLLRAHPAAQTSRARWEKKEGQSTACTVLAQQVGRAVSDRLTRAVAFDTQKCCHGYWRRAGEPSASRDSQRSSRHPVRGNRCHLASLNADEHRGLSPCSLCRDWTPALAPV
jgi:transposase